LAKTAQAFWPIPKQRLFVLDIPLILKTGGNKRMDAVACVTVSGGKSSKIGDGTPATMTLEQFRKNIRANRCQTMKNAPWPTM